MKKFTFLFSLLMVFSLYATDIELSAENNITSTTITLEEGDRLIVPTPESAGGQFEILARIQPIGAAELVLPTTPAYDEVVLSGALWATNGGSLHVTGGSLSFGKELTMTDLNYPRFDCPISFDAGNGLVLTNASTVHVLPSAPTPLSIAHGAILAVRGTNTLERFMNSGETPSFTITTNYTVQVHDDSAFPAGTHITVKPGGILALKPCVDKFDGPASGLGWN